MEKRVDLNLSLDDFNLILQALSVRTSQLRKYSVVFDKNRKLLLGLRSIKSMFL